jgi:hypothetical protein
VSPIWTDSFSFVMGAVRRRGLAILALVKDASIQKRIEHTFFFEWSEGEWAGSETALPWGVVGMTVCTHPIEQVLALGENGQVWCCGSGDVHEERVHAADAELRHALRGIRAIGGRAYAVGMDRQAFRREATGLWLPIDRGARPTPGGPVAGFEAVDGFTENEIYAVGWNGAIWSYDGDRWSEIASPTNLILNDVCCAGDGVAYACSQRGGLLRGRGRRWEPIENPTTSDDIWRLAWYRDRLYLSTMRAVYALEGDEIVPVAMGDDPPATCFHLSTRDDVLWSIGAKDVMAFDGENWARID